MEILLNVLRILMITEDDITELHIYIVIVSVTGKMYHDHPA